jgi:c-di-AMP phosphodiesterase-like protein
MNRDNYSLNLKYRNKKDPSLQYTNKHGSIMMKMSLMMNIIIPLLTHFIAVKKIQNCNGFLLEVFDYVLHMFDIDLYNKLYETSLTNISKNKQRHPIWNKQDIRGINVTTHTLASINNIILNIMPKYEYNKNIINFNYQSIKYNIQFQVTDIGYEYNFIPLSSSKRDED